MNARRPLPGCSKENTLHGTGRCAVSSNAKLTGEHVRPRLT
jgi:hypothetical protein